MALRLNASGAIRAFSTRIRQRKKEIKIVRTAKSQLLINCKRIAAFGQLRLSLSKRDLFFNKILEKIKSSYIYSF